MNTYGKNVEIKVFLAIGFLAFMLLLTPQSANAEWYWLTIPEDPTIGEFTELSAVEYAVTQIPRDQLQVVEDSLFNVSDLAEDSESCSSNYSLSAIVEKLRKYDAEHDFYTVTETVKQGDIKQGYTYVEISTTTNQSTIDGREKLIDSILTNADDCLEKEKAELEKKEREERVATALETCDFDYFENEMTNEERMHTWNERQKCVNKTEVVTPESVTPIAEEVVAPPTTSIVPQTISAPVTTPKPVLITPSPTENDATVTNHKDEATSTTHDNTQGVTEEIVDLEVQAEQQTEEFENLSFFKKITNFFIKIFSW